MRNFIDIGFGFNCTVTPIDFKGVVVAVKLDFKLTSW